MNIEIIDKVKIFVDKNSIIRICDDNGKEINNCIELHISNYPGSVETSMTLISKNQRTKAIITGFEVEYIFENNQ